MTIELNAHGMRYELWLRRSANDGRSAVEHKALPLHVAAVVAAGDPAITDELKLRGWVKVQPESKTLAEAGAQLLFASTAALRTLQFIAAAGPGSVLNLNDVKQQADKLREAIDGYTDNVAPPEDEPLDTEIIHGQTISLRAHRIVYPAGSEPLFDRAVLPDELDEDPELDADETDRQLYAIKHHQMNTKGDLLRVQTALADVAEIVFTQADDASACVLKLQELLRHDHLEAKPEGALDLSLAGNLRALLVCLDPDAADNLVEPFAVLERITVLVSELEARAADAEQSLSSAAEQLGKETLARVNADRARHEMQDELGRVASVLIVARHTPAGVEDTAAQVRKLATKLQEHDNEREAARRLVHAAAIDHAEATTATARDVVDAIHDWLEVQPAGEATSATAQFIEMRIGIRDSSPIDLPSPKVVKATNLEHGWDFNTWGENAPQIPKPPSLPTDGYGNLLGTDESAGTKVANALMWVVGKLFPKT